MSVAVVGANTTVYIRVIVPVIVRDRIDNLYRVLCRCGAVQIGQRITVDLLMQDRKVTPYRFNIEAGSGRKLVGSGQRCV
jgi:hypothetical protein